MSLPSKEVLDARFREKLAARDEGRTPVFSAPATLQGDSQAEVEARYRAKLANHGKVVAAPAVESQAGDGPDEDKDPKGLTELTKAQLIEESEKLGLKLSKELTKAQLIEEIERAKAAVG